MLGVKMILIFKSILQPCHREDFSSQYVLFRVSEYMFVAYMKWG